MMNHFSETYSKDIKDFAESIFPNYLFTRKKEGKQFGYCTACKKEFITDRLSHKEAIECPGCKERVSVQSVNMGRSKMVDEIYFIYYEKSIVDPAIIVARGILAVRDWRGIDYKHVEPVMTDRTRYIFEFGKGGTMLKQYAFYNWQFKKMHTGQWENARSVYNDLHSWVITCPTRKIAWYSHKSMVKSVQGTPFQYMPLNGYIDESGVDLFNLYSMYPKAVEYLTKLGFERLVDAKLTGNLTCGAVNWRADTIFKMLRINRLDLKIINNSGVVKTPFFMRLYQINKKSKNGLDVFELKKLEDTFGVNQAKEISLIAKYTSLKKAFNYIKKQYNTCKDDKGKRHFYTKADTLRHYRDYINDCSSLEMDLNSESILFPKNLFQAHQNTIAQVKVKGDKRLDEKITKRVKALSAKYCFEYSGLLIRPAMSSKELIDEGAALHHCVGTYVKRYADSHTNILFIRKLSKPNKPYYTVEISNEGKVWQVRGLNNCSANEEVKEFIEAFKAEKLGKKREGIPA